MSDEIYLQVDKRVLLGCGCAVLSLIQTEGESAGPEIFERFSEVLKNGTMDMAPLSAFIRDVFEKANMTDPSTPTRIAAVLIQLSRLILEVRFADDDGNSSSEIDFDVLNRRIFEDAALLVGLKLKGVTEPPVMLRLDGLAKL